MCLLKWSQWRCLANEIKSVTLDGWVNLILNFRLKCYVSHQYLWTVRWGMVRPMLQLAAGRFHTKKLCSRLYSTELEFYFLKQKNDFLIHPLGDLGVTYALHRWKARGQLPLRHNWPFFAISYEWDHRIIILLWLSRYKRKSVEVGVFRRGWVSLSCG